MKRIIPDIGTNKDFNILLKLTPKVFIAHISNPSESLTKQNTAAIITAILHPRREKINAQFKIILK